MSAPYAAVHPRAWVGHNSVRLVVDCRVCRGPAIVRDPAEAAISGKGWVDCECGQHFYCDSGGEFTRLWRRHAIRA